MNDGTDYAAWVCSQQSGVSFNTDIDGPFDARLTVIKYNLSVGTERAHAKIIYSNLGDSNQSDNWGDADRSDTVIVGDKVIHLKTAMAVFGNGGHCRLPTTSRASRFYGYVFQPISMDNVCANEECLIKYSVGDTG